jgi:hypothetical protein
MNASQAKPGPSACPRWPHHELCQSERASPGECLTCIEATKASMAATEPAARLAEIWIMGVTGNRPGWWTPALEAAEQAARARWGQDARVWAEFDRTFTKVEQYGIGVFEEHNFQLVWKEYGWDLETAMKNAMAHPPADFKALDYVTHEKFGEGVVVRRIRMLAEAEVAFLGGLQETVAEGTLKLWGHEPDLELQDIRFELTSHK